MLIDRDFLSVHGLRLMSINVNAGGFQLKKGQGMKHLRMVHQRTQIAPDSNRSAANGQSMRIGFSVFRAGPMTRKGR